jgi:hypothetical protein
MNKESKTLLGFSKMESSAPVAFCFCELVKFSIIFFPHDTGSTAGYHREKHKT